MAPFGVGTDVCCVGAGIFNRFNSGLSELGNSSCGEEKGFPESTSDTQQSLESHIPKQEFVKEFSK